MPPSATTFRRRVDALEGRGHPGGVEPGQSSSSSRGRTSPSSQRHEVLVRAGDGQRRHVDRAAGYAGSRDTESLATVAVFY
jgi:hypothetical protein